MVDVCCNKVVIFREDLLFDVFRAAFVLFGCISDPFQEALQASLGKTTVITEMQGCRYQTACILKDSLQGSMAGHMGQTRLACATRHFQIKISGVLSAW